MKTLFRRPGVTGLLFAQSQVAFTDNAAKFLLIGLVQIVLTKEEADPLVSTVALLLVAPFVLFAPLGGWLADRFPKRHVLAVSLWLQLAVAFVLILAVSIHSLPLAVGGFFLLGIQSALMSPARRGMAKELAEDSVGEIVGWMEMFCIAAILVGGMAGGQLIDGLTHLLGGTSVQAWTAGLISFSFLAVGCVAALVGFRSVPARQAATQAPFQSRVIFGHLDLLKTLRRDRGIWRAALGDAVFYFAGGVLLLSLAEVGRELYPDGIGAARTTSLMMAVMGIGVAVGSLLTARLSRRGHNLGLAPAGALGMAAALLILTVAASAGVVFYTGLALLGLSGGFFIVPLGTYLVERSPEEERGRILAASSLLSSVAGVGAVGAYALTAGVLDISAPGQFALLAVLMVATAVYAARLLPQHLLRLVALAVARTRYSVNPIGELPAKGGALLICNHVSYVDTLILSLATPRMIRFLSYDGFSKTPILGSILRIAGAIPVSATRAKEAITRAADCIRDGDIVCIFPEGQLTRTGNLMELKSGFELIARRAKCPVFVAHLDGLWGSIHSFEGARYFTKLPRGLRRHATVSFRPLDEISTERARELMLEMGEAALRNRTRRADVTGGIFRAMESSPFRTALIDPSSPKKSLTNLELLALGWRLATRWKRSLPDGRVGVILPPGMAGAAVNLSLILAGKVPVNLNPTLSEGSIRSCLRQSGVTTIITAAAVQEKLPKFPWPEQIVLVETLIAALPRRELVTAMAQLLLLPRFLLLPLVRLPKAGPDDEAVLLFTSGTSGCPKGVALSHANLFANFQQISETAFLRQNDRLLCSLPLFHCFGLTMGLYFPLLAGRTIVTAPSPLDSDRIADAARLGRPTVLLSTPTFLRNYTKRIPRDAFGPLRLAVAGAERLPAETAAAFRERFGCEVLEGYGLTEASPVLSFNVPHPPCGRGADSIQQGSREGSVGRLLPGIALRLFDQETGAPSRTRGLLAVRGANVVDSYLEGQDPEKFREGWFLTGDIVRVDEEGFLFIEGRSSRFSKIGGEMVSHSAVETALAGALPGEAQDCVLGLACSDKGERLVLLTTRPLTRESLREALNGLVPNLWIPRDVLRLEKLPGLASGKLDLAECRRLATVNFATL
jgi:acyl-[acyl-carrier-protein]-phospholipid O-acyltransferase/long-chain-fatty-acid--[acyl-carrier-protein] ligase